MKVEELIERLQELVRENPAIANEDVYSSYNYGDYGRTEAIGRVECAVVSPIAETPYSSSGLRVERRFREGCPTKVVLGMYQEHEYCVGPDDDDEDCA